MKTESMKPIVISYEIKFLLFDLKKKKIFAGLI